MIVSRRLSLNLASDPLRNRRFFYLLLSTLVAVLLLVSFFSGKTFIEYRSKTKEIKASIKKTDQMIKNAQRDEKNFSARVEEEVKSHKAKVDLINTIILGKSFSWIQFFSDLENSLPDSSYIVSLQPALTEDSKLQLRLKVASSGVNDLLKLIDNLKALKFNQIRIKSEAVNESGLLISEISLSYERNI